MQEHERQLKLEHQKLATAAHQDMASAHSQIAKMSRDLEAAKQRIVALQRSWTDSDSAHTQALQVAHSFPILTASVSNHA